MNQYFISKCFIYIVSKTNIESRETHGYNFTELLGALGWHALAPNTPQHRCAILVALVNSRRCWVSRMSNTSASQHGSAQAQAQLGLALARPISVWAQRTSPEGVELEDFFAIVSQVQIDSNIMLESNTTPLQIFT